MRLSLLALLAAAVLLTGCDELLGTKDDDTTDEIFEEGRLDPTQLNDAEYVPLLPFFREGGEGATLEAPTDVAVGFDEFLYVVDANGLHVLDLAGRPATFVGEIAGQEIRDAAAVIQDRRFHVYVAARRDTTVQQNNQTLTFDLPVVYHLSGVTDGGEAVLEDIIWYPFDILSRSGGLGRLVTSSDELVQFNGLAIAEDRAAGIENGLYVAQSGSVNTIEQQQDVILLFNEEGQNLGAAAQLSATTSSLRSSVNPTDVLTRVLPPQRPTYSDGRDFFVAQSPYESGTPPGPDADASLRYGVVSIRVVETPNGLEYQSDPALLAPVGNEEAGESFLYDEFAFENPTGLAYAADGSGYLFVTDSGTDSLYVFTSGGVEGVAPPPGATSNLPINVSFGGTGDGAREFRNPEGVTYFEEIVYVADTGNNRISRFRLNTDFE